MNYSHMQPTVDAICKSMLERPQDWIVRGFKVEHTPSGVRYWMGSAMAITEVMVDSAPEKVFSYEQGCQIREALDKMSEKKAIEHKATKAQEKLMKAFDTTPQVIQYVENIKRPWWKFW